MSEQRFDVVAYRDSNGRWKQKYNVSRADYDTLLETMLDVRTFSWEEWAEICQRALDQHRKLSQLLDEL